MTDKPRGDEAWLFVAGGICSLVFLPVVLAAVGCWLSLPVVREHFRKVLCAGLVFILGAGISFFLLLSNDALWRIGGLDQVFVLGLSWREVASFVVLAWIGGTGLILLLAPAVAFLKPVQKSDVIRRADYENAGKKVAKGLQDVSRYFQDPMRVPIGVDLKNGQVFYLLQNRRCSGVLNVGATGGGKSNLLRNMILHAIYHEQPCVAVDPKGEEADIERLFYYIKKISPLAARRGRVFRINNPDRSAQYNPLKHGSATQLKDKVLEALNWSEQYYQSISGEFLTVFISSLIHLGQELSFQRLRVALSQKSEMAVVLNQLKDKALKGDNKALALMERMGAFISGVDAKDLGGLAAQLAVIDNPEIGPLLSFRKAMSEIDFRELYLKNEFALFVMDTLGSADTARRIGRVIVEDTKALASWVYSTIPDERNRKFVPVFIDEFGAFASKEFIEILKQQRGARIASHLFCQGLEDLDAVSVPFRRQASANPLTKIALRLDDKQTVDELCAMAGTANTLEQSYQVESGLTGPTRTGMGNMRETKQMVVEHDVVKNQEIGDCVVIEKSPSRVSAVRIFKTSDLVGAI